MKKYLLDSSFLIDLLNEIAAGEAGPAMTWLQDHRRARLWISAITLAEVLEGAGDVNAVSSYLGRYSFQGIHRIHAEKTGALQRRAAQRMSENDAWQYAVAACMDATIVGHEHAFQRLGDGYADHRSRPL